MNKNTVKSPRPVGRPAAKIVWPNKIFTMKELAAANPNVCTLTVINHKDKALDTKFLTLLEDTVKTGKVGKPAFRFIRTSILARRQKARAATAPVEVSLETPVEATPVAEVPVEAAALAVA